MRRIIIVSMVALFLLILGGCTQREDIVTSIKRSELTLDPANLPSPPDSLVYELWISKQTLVDTSVDMGQTVSLGRFSYIKNDTISSFLDVAGVPRSTVFPMEGDFRACRTLFVSVQRRSDPAGTRPGPIILIAYVPSQTDIPIKMLFPQADSLWTATCRYNFEGISDNNRNAGNGSGIWFTSYRTESMNFPDTTALTVDTTAIDTMRPESCGTPRVVCNLESLTREYDYSITNIRQARVRIQFPNDTLILGVDSFMHTQVLYDVIRKKDTVPPYTRRRLKFNYTTSPDSVRLDIFTQDNFGLPDLTEWGWRYNGWVASPTIPLNDSIWKMSPPAWQYKNYYQVWLRGIDSGVLSTGTFAHVDAPDDDGNPYALNDYLPPYPGEDFLNTTALQTHLGISSVNVLPLPSGNPLTVFISVEPNNRVTTKTNFPLIPFYGTAPFTTGYQDSAYSMHNATSTLMGNTVDAFPVINVSVKRF